MECVGAKTDSTVKQAYACLETGRGRGKEIGPRCPQRADDPPNCGNLHVSESARGLAQSKICRPFEGLDDSERLGVRHRPDRLGPSGALASRTYRDRQFKSRPTEIAFLKQ